MRIWVAAVVAIAVGSLAGVATVASDLATRPTCPPPCTGQVCALVYCFVFPIDWTREIAIGGAVGAAVAAIAFLLLRKRGVRSRQPAV